MAHIIIYRSTGKRVRVGSRLVPVFEHLPQAVNYLKNRLGDSPYMTIINV